MLEGISSFTRAWPLRRARPDGCRAVRLAPMVACAWLVAAGVASATVVLPAEFVEMVSDSQLIVHGRVTAVQARTSGDHRTIESIVTLAVTQSMKGTAGGVVVFRVPNGQIGRYRRVTVGAPEFRPGDEVVVFLKGRAPVVPMPYGLNQGVYRVRRAASGRSLVTPAAVQARTSGGERVVRGDPARRAVPVETFARQVRAITEGGAAAGAVIAAGEGLGGTRPGADTGRPRPERRQ